jgi:hypothetical protein
VGINYSPNPPKEIFYLYDWVIIHPNAKTYNGSAKKFAYISIGEQNQKLPYKIIGENKNWHTYIYDIGDKKYQQYLLQKIKNCKNFDGFMFDTLDSFLLTKTDKLKYETSLSNFINKVHKLYPDKKIILNRGFEIYKNVKDSINAVLIENFLTLHHTPTTANEQKWLLNKIKPIQKDGKKIIIVDYVKNHNLKKAKKIAKKIASYGFIPFVSNINLTDIGVSSNFIIPRKILVLYDEKKSLKFSSTAHLLYSMPLEYLGYIPVLKRYDELPHGYLNQKFAGIVVAFNGPIENEDKFFNWIYLQIKNGLKVVFLGDFGFSAEEYFNTLGLKTLNDKTPNAKLVYKNSIVGFEIKPKLLSLQALQPVKNYTPIMQYKKEHLFTTCAYTSWGGYCQNPFYMFNNEDALWTINPFIYFKNALKLPDVPMPDTTTENGERIFFSHIDGDGFMEFNYNSKKFSSEMLYEKIFTKYKFPISASIIEAELAPYGLYPQWSKQLIKIAKKIYKLPNIEPASHTFSHPFVWNNPNPPRLKVKNYSHFSIAREITGSFNFIQKLLPKSKKINLLFWSGDCMPTYKALKYCKDRGILSINGGDTKISDEAPFLCRVYPLGIYNKDIFQVYAPMDNENIYTNLWHNKAGFIKLIQTIKLTENPRRLKPIDVYYHFYSGSTFASLYALKRIYDYVLKQDVIPMKTSEWIRIAHDFENIVISKSISSNEYFVNGNGNLRTLKIKGKYRINFNLSKNVIGKSYQKGYTYISLTPNKKHTIIPGNDQNFPYLIKANARIDYYKALKNGYILKFKPYIPFKAEFHYVKSCKVITNAKKTLKHKKLYLNSNKKTVSVKVMCD